MRLINARYNMTPYPNGTDPLMTRFLAMNCQATITQSLRDGILFARIRGNKLPGYHQLVPTGHIHFLVARGADHAQGLRMSQSIRNRIPGTIREITSDPVLSEVVLDTTIGPVAAVITTRSLKELGLTVGDSVYGLVKATNVSIEKE